MINFYTNNSDLKVNKIFPKNKHTATNNLDTNIKNIAC